MIRTRLAPLLLLLAAACAPLAPAARPEPAALQRHGAVSAADPRASEAGMEILRRGGSATDAALATMVALTVVEPQSSGIGGGSFLVHHRAGGGVTSYDGRETAPAAAGPDWFFRDGQPMTGREAVPGGRSVGVPGNFRLMALAHAKHGRLPWADLFRPAIRLARDGFEVTPRLHEFLVERAGHVEQTDWVRRTFYTRDGAPLPVGTRIRNPELAAFLERIARNGADYYYTGTPAQAVVRTVNGAVRNPSRMTLADFADYQAKERPPVCGLYRGHRICGMGPPSSGGVAVFAILKQLERFDLAALGPEDPRAWHLIAESMRLAYADRDAYLADADFVTVPVAGLIDEAYLARRSRLISLDRAMPTVAAGTPAGAPRVAELRIAEAPSTSHLVAADRAGNIASLTSTIEGPWGSGLTVDGYFLNNELTDFSLAPEREGRPVANRVQGGKRPRSSMSPTIVYGPGGDVRVAIGAAGGATIIAQVAKALVGIIDWNLSAADALALPQIMGTPDRVTVERGSRLEAMIPALQRMGHAPQAVAFPLKANAIEWSNGRWIGAADPRSEGVALAE
jgi:gamma-glutamyltranspeptidase / glutathione hydrolase